MHHSPNTFKETPRHSNHRCRCMNCTSKGDDGVVANCTSKGDDGVVVQELMTEVVGVGLFNGVD